MANEGKRRIFLINRKFQLKWTLIITLVGTLSAGMFGAALWYSIEKENTSLGELIKSDESLKKESQDIMILLLNMPDRTDQEKEKYQKQYYDIGAKYQQLEDAKKQMIGRNKTNRYLIIGFVVLIGVFLFTWGIFLTHKVAGPLFVIQKSLEKLGAEGHVQMRPLRKGDEFKDVYQSICENLQKITSDK